MLYKRCAHKGRDRDRCADHWYASYQLKGRPRAKVSLAKWTGRTITSKTEAQVAFDDLKTEVRAGRFSPLGLAVSQPPKAEEGPLTFAWLTVMYETHYVKAKRLRTRDDFSYRTKPLREYFGIDPIHTITATRIEDFQTHLRTRATLERKSVAFVNRPVSLLRAMLTWAVKRAYLDVRPELKLDKEDYSRWRRVSPDEERQLLEATNDRLRALIIMALDTGMRRGEMLALRVGDVDLTTGVIRLRGTTTKDAETRDLPILTARLRTVFAYFSNDAQGRLRPALAPLVLDDSGDPFTDLRYGWNHCRLRAYGFTPISTPTGGLTAVCRRQLQEIDLHWHDLRHEFACRLDDRGVALGKIQRLLGHASIGTTERYLRRGLKDLQTIVLDDGTLAAFNPPAACLNVSQPNPKVARALPPAVELSDWKTGTS